ncbi:uncharacterized protein LOC126682630 [Mercurialis annua]|uniref:uncharacterized protein LOC126682630 n=1 Tax=Mercurialis annua TaxID=3986 RepID=UPI0021606DE0|nr:uncharacterized protein LOC126682630 [Mercurialis annua]
MTTAQLMPLNLPHGGDHHHHHPGQTMPSLYVGDLDPQVTEIDLRNVFSSVGPVLSLRLCRCKFTGRSLCYAYVNYYSFSQAYKALETLNHAYLKGKAMRLMWSQRNPFARKRDIGNLYVKNLDTSVDSAGLHRLFSKYGNVLSCKIVEENGKSKGFGFVQFDSEDSALTARTALHDTVLKEKKLYVSRFVRKTERTVATSCEEIKFTNLYVKDLPDNMTPEAFQAMFSAFGEVTSAVIMKNHNGKSRGFGFVSFKSSEAAKKAVDTLNGTQLGSRTLFVGRAQKKAERTKILQYQYRDKLMNNMKNLEASNLYVNNLAACVDDKKLKEFFRIWGHIISAKVMRYDSGASRGFGFVRFSSPKEAMEALQMLNGTMFFGKALYVAVALNKKDRLLEQQKNLSQFQPQAPYMFDSSVFQPPISSYYHSFYPYLQQVPYQNQTFSYHNLGANISYEYPYAARSYNQYYSTYIPMAEMPHGFQNPADGSCPQPSLNSGTQLLSYKRKQNSIGGAAGNSLKKLVDTAKSSGKSNKVRRNLLYPHTENSQSGLSGNLAALIAEMSNSIPPNLLGLQADRAAQVLKEVNRLKSPEADDAALPKTGGHYLNN